MLLVDMRLGGVPRYTIGQQPQDWNMRLPDVVKGCVGFLCVEEPAGSMRLKGTAFLVSVPIEGAELDLNVLYLVTAKHCVTMAQAAGARLYLRLNTAGGIATAAKLETEWVYPDDEATDLAVCSISLEHSHFDFKVIPFDTLASADVVQREAIGIGDELFVVGLFVSHAGVTRNVPIVRQGTIAAMPEEPIEDRNSGLPFRAILAEMRSIGGLSGSPVFVRMGPVRSAPDGDVSLSAGFRFYLAGVMRGHWEFGDPRSGDDEREWSVHAGIALVTPAEELRALLTRDDLVRERRRAGREWLLANRGTVAED